MPPARNSALPVGPWWQAKLDRSEFTAWQASARGGLIRLSVRGERVLLRGKAVMISRVEFRH
jgi:hypothetical protein